MDLLFLGIISMGAFAFGIIFAYLLIKNNSKSILRKSEAQAQKLLSNTEHQTREILLRAENTALDYRKKIESETDN